MLVRFSKFLVAALLMACAASSPFVARAASFTGLGVLPGKDSSLFVAASADGTVVVGESDAFGAPYSPEAFRWTRATGLVSLGFLPGTSVSSVSAVSADGSVVAGMAASQDEQGNHGRAYRWTAATGMVGLDLLDAATSYVVGLSSDGSVIAGSLQYPTPPRISEAFRWSAADGVVKLGLLPGGESSQAEAVSADGSTVIGWATVAGVPVQSFRWRQATGMTNLGVLSAGDACYAMAVSADGSAIAGYCIHYDQDGPIGSEPFRWTEATGLVSLGGLPGESFAYAYAISGDGETIAGESAVDNYADESDHVFVWTSAQGMVGLDRLPGYDYATFSSLSPDGTVVTGAVHDVSWSVSEPFVWDAGNATRGAPALLAGLGGENVIDWTLYGVFGAYRNETLLIGVGLSPTGQYMPWIADLAASLNVAPLVSRALLLNGR